MHKPFTHSDGSLTLPFFHGAGNALQRQSTRHAATRLAARLAVGTPLLLAEGTLLVARLGARGIYRLFVPAW